MRILRAHEFKVVLTLSLPKGEGGSRALINAQRQFTQNKSAGAFAPALNFRADCSFD